MSNDNSSFKARAHNNSTADPFPQGRPRRFEPITHDRGDDNVNEEGARMTGTMRRNRPPAISTSSGDNYGMFFSKVEECG